MKTLRQEPIRIEFVELVPDVLLPNVMYYSEKYRGAAHLCLCGCGEKTYVPVMDGEWSITQNEKGFSMTPSLAHRFACKSHYIITNGIANFV